MRASTDAETAIKTVQDLSDNQQIFFMVDSLNHLKRGGRISATKAFIGAILGIKPILTINKHGKLAVVDKTKTNKAVDFFLAAIAKHSNPGEDFNGKTILVLFTVKTEVYKSMYEAVKAKYPSARVKEAQVGPIIGSHVGGGTMGVFFPGKPRLDV
jgi:DegV family protein with EDD domain